MQVNYRNGVHSYGGVRPFSLKKSEVIVKSNIIASISHYDKEYLVNISANTAISRQESDSNNFWIIAEIDSFDGNTKLFTTSVDHDDQVYVDTLPAAETQNANLYRFDRQRNTGFIQMEGKWSPCFRVKLAAIRNGEIDLYPLTTQVTYASSSAIPLAKLDFKAESIYFDNYGKCRKIFVNSQVYYFISGRPSNTYIEESDFLNAQVTEELIASEQLPAYSFIELKNDGTVGLCVRGSQKNCLGMLISPVEIGDTIDSYITDGIVTNLEWQFLFGGGKIGDTLFVSSAGLITLEPPNISTDDSIQYVGEVLSNDTIHLSIQPVILIYEI